MRFVLDVATAIIIALILGAGTALFVLDQRSRDGSIMVGAWAARSGQTAAADPYAEAAAAIRVDLPLGAAEGLEFLATRDDAGNPLDAACDYVISGRVLPARLWTLTLQDEVGLLVPNVSNRTGFHSRELLRTPDGNFAITVSPEVWPGNWLPSGGTLPLRLVLRLYDTPLTTGLMPAGLALPSITRGDCR